MGDPRPDKVAIVEEVRDKLSSSGGLMLTEYRGLDVPAMAELRRALREAGSEYKIYKNTLVRLAAREIGLEIDELLTGPTAIAFVGEKADGTPGDVAAAAKALRDFAKGNDALVLKGGVLDDKLLSSEDLKALAKLPSRDVLLAQLAGAFQAPIAKMAGLLQALPRDFAYGLKALIDQGGAADAPADTPAEVSDEAEATETPAEVSDEAEATETQASDDAETNQKDASTDADDQESADADPQEA